MEATNIETEVKRVRNTLNQIADLCESEIESRGRFDTSQTVLEINQLVHELILSLSFHLPTEQVVRHYQELTEKE